VGISAAEIERAQEAERHRHERERSIAVLASQLVDGARAAGLSREEKLVLMGKIASAIDETPAAATDNMGVTPSLSTAILSHAVVAGMAALGRGAVGGSLSSRTLKLVTSSPAGVTVRDVAQAVYGATDRITCHRARGLLDYLSRQEAIHARDGKWFVGKAETAKKVRRGRKLVRRAEDSSATPLVRRVLVETDRPLKISEIATAVLAFNGDVPKPHIYSVVYKMAKRGEVLPTDDGRYIYKRGTAA